MIKNRQNSFSPVVQKNKIIKTANDWRINVDDCFRQFMKELSNI
jgi:hypothetical protein